jgi:thymidylate synthase (FAD)
MATGHTHSAETRRKIAEALRGRKRPEMTGERNPMYGRLGALNPNWKGGTSPERVRVYYQTRWKRLVKLCRERDNHQCQKCETWDHLRTHHIWPWRKFPQWRFELWNLLTLCKTCHAWVHSKENVERLFLKGEEGR